MDNRRTIHLQRIETRVEQEIRELHDSGALRGLPGEGAPLPPDPDADARDAWAARHIARSAAVRPGWADLRQEIASTRTRLLARLRAHDAWLGHRAALVERLPAEQIVGETARTRESDRRLRQELAGAVEELNAMVRLHNLLVTASMLQLPAVTVERLVADARAPRGEPPSG